MLRIDCISVAVHEGLCDRGVYIGDSDIGEVARVSVRRFTRSHAGVHGGRSRRERMRPGEVQIERIQGRPSGIMSPVFGNWNLPVTQR